MENLRAYIKKKKIAYGYIREETGFTKEHISSVLTGRTPPSERFLRIVIRALHKYSLRDLEEFNAFIGETPWQELL